MQAPESPAASFYRRPLPAEHIAFASPEGRQLFREALAEGGMEGWFALAEQFHTQADPAFCGLGTLVVVLNALEIDPGRVWKGAWRWYGEDLLDCCLPLSRVQQKGVTMDELACLARCNGASARIVRADQAPADELRAQVRAAAATARGPVLVAGYDRSLVGQTGSGHFSPIAGYHAARDLVLILDVARFKYPPHWIPLATLWNAMTGTDPATGKTRGWIVLDRGGQRASLPLHFRMTADEGLTALATTLLQDAPALLAKTPAGTPEDFVAGWVRQVEAHLAGRIGRGLGPRPAAPAELSAEQRPAIEALLAQLRRTTVFQAIVRARGSTQDATAAQAAVSDEVLATLLLALPDWALSRLPADVQAIMSSLRDPADVGPALSAEIACLREQMAHLGQYQGPR